MSDLQSRPYGTALAACELCIFGTGKHAEWCPLLKDAAAFANALKNAYDDSQLEKEEV